MVDCILWTKQYDKSTTVHIYGIGDTSLTTSDRPIASALSQAINNLETGTNNNKTDEDKQLQAQAIVDIWDENKSNLSEQSAKEIDQLINAYLDDWGVNSVPSKLYNIAVLVDEYLEGKGYQGQTAYDRLNNNKKDPEQWVNKDTEIKDAEASVGAVGVPGVLGNIGVGSLSPTPDKIIENAQDFRNAGNATIPIDGNNIKEGSSSLYNILLAIAFFLAVAIGMYLGVKMMLSNAEDKAKTKEAIIPYVAGCVVVFGAFAIWKLAITLLSGIG